MNLAEVIQAIGLLILTWIAGEVRALRTVTAKHGEQLARLEERIRSFTGPVFGA